MYVRSSFDIDNPPSLTDAERAELERLAAMRDEDIDTSDIPEVKFENVIRFRDRRQHPLYRPIKQSTTIRIDADVLQWLRAKGKGYQTRINAILREAMVRDERVRDER
ncbi:BrnA antitoxin family protein [uncultured Sphingomonas sp.]|uniref:BrnA antitoxin family protein n=1 Tax=uncultured Sphingomonas sp. TaxID=158754 RepID=UPI0035CB2487